MLRVQDKITKAADKIILTGQLSTELLSVNNARQKEREERNNAPNKVVQKYGEIYGHIARRQIIADEMVEDRIVNIHKNRLRKPFLQRWQGFIKELPNIFYLGKSDGK